MSSRSGFARADVDVGYYHDPRAIALARRQRDCLRTLATLGLHHAVILGSWREGRRITLAEAAPAWFVDDLEPFLVDLVAVGLLDPDGALTERAFAAWVGHVIDVHEAASEAGRRGAAKRWNSGANGEANGEASSGANGGANSPAGLPASRPATPAGLPAGPSHSRAKATPVNRAAEPPCFLEPDHGRCQHDHYAYGQGQNGCRTCEAAIPMPVADVREGARL